MVNYRFLAASMGCVIGMCSTASVGADEWIKPGEETVKLIAGVFLPTFNTGVRVNTNRVGGARVDLEDAFGLSEDETTWYATAYWRIAPRHRIRVGYLNLDREANRVAETNIQIGDGEVISAGAGVSTRLDFQTIPVAYAYSFFKKPNHELAVNLGLHWASVEFSVAATAWVQDLKGEGRVSASAGIPMPLIGLNYDYWINDRWSLNASAAYFAIDMNLSDYDFQGSLYDIRLGTEYWLSNNVGLGAAVDAFGLNADLDQSDWQGSVDYDYWGPQLYLTARF